jgi:hypothetical protein
MLDRRGLAASTEDEQVVLVLVAQIHRAWRRQCLPCISHTPLEQRGDAPRAQVLACLRILRLRGREVA